MPDFFERCSLAAAPRFWVGRSIGSLRASEMVSKRGISNSSRPGSATPDDKKGKKSKGLATSVPSSSTSRVKVSSVSRTYRSTSVLVT